MSTASSTATWQEIRDRILDFPPPAGGSTLRTSLTGGLHVGSAPDDVTYPYGVMRVTANREGEDGDHREVLFVELMLYNRPRLKGLKVVEAFADLADQALYKWVSTTDGGPMFTGPRTRTTLPVFPDPADRDIAAVRLLYRVVAWPKWLAVLS